jgi:hypothetical protein
MQNWLETGKQVLEVVSYGVMSLTLLATFIARLTKTPKDDETVGKIKDILLKVLRLSPTIGVNPQTKALEDEIERLRSEQKK